MTSERHLSQQTIPILCFCRLWSSPSLQYKYCVVCRVLPLFLMRQCEHILQACLLKSLALCDMSTPDYWYLCNQSQNMVVKVISGGSFLFAFCRLYYNVYPLNVSAHRYDYIDT